MDLNHRCAKMAQLGSVVHVQDAYVHAQDAYMHSDIKGLKHGKQKEGTTLLLLMLQKVHTVITQIVTFNCIFFCFLQLYPEYEGVIHVSSWTRKNSHVSD